MKKKFFWINLFVAILIFVTSGLATAFAIARPIYLTETEIIYYTEVAENIWYNGLCSVEPDEGIVIKYNLNDKTVRISSPDTNKQSITVNFSSEKNDVVINKPLTSFIGCFLFYGALWTFLSFVLSGMFLCTLSDIIKKRKEKRTKLKIIEFP